MKNKFIVILILISRFILANESITTINGFAPKYIGQKVEVFALEDYISMKEKLIATSVVKDDSTFRVSFFNDKTQKIIIRSSNNMGFIYVQPESNYSIYFPLKNKYDEYRPLGNQVEIAFQNLNENDINFKILAYERWMNNFLGEYFYKKNLSGLEFVHKLDTFKMNVFKAYEKDSSYFFKTYIKYSIASLDDIQYLGARNRYEKYDFYLKNAPVAYENSSYMDYFNTFYKNILSKISQESNNRVYLGVLESSPTLAINALGEEYTNKNIRILELVLIKTLAENFFTGEFPQTNILTILDSLSGFSIFKEHKLIAKNVIEKLTEISPGSKTPDFRLITKDGKSVISNSTFLNKHLYIQFVDLSIKESAKEIDLLVGLFEKYKQDIDFLTVIKTQYKEEPTNPFLSKIKWSVVYIEPTNPILKDFKISSFPSYVLIDSFGYIVDSPALKPSPNGKYETIDKSFFYIKKIKDEERKEGK